jgi:hypothetical protein
VKEINYQEALFTVPSSANRYDLHKSVMDTYSMGAPFDGRTFIYDVRCINDHYSAITIREDKLPDHFHPTTKHERFVTGEQRHFMMTLNIIRRSEGKSIPVDCVETFIKERLERNGWSEIDICNYQTQLLSVRKKRDSLKLFVARIEVKARVSEPEKAAFSFLYGIGRAKGFGVGTLMLKSNCHAQ